MVKIGLDGRFGLYNKKAPQKVLIINGARYCAVIGLKTMMILSRKIEIFREKQKT